MAEQMNEILSSHRKVADEAVADVMLDAFREVGAFLAETEEAEGVVLEFDKGAGAFNPADLENALVHWRKQDLVEWFIGLSELERTTLIMRFLDYDRLRIQEFRARYPKAFMKWSAEEDAELSAMYSGQCSWREMSAHFGRNTNALKLRLERLGFDLGANAGRSRFHPRPQPGAGSAGAGSAGAGSAGASPTQPAAGSSGARPTQPAAGSTGGSYGSSSNGIGDSSDSNSSGGNGIGDNNGIGSSNGIGDSNGSFGIGDSEFSGSGGSFGIGSSEFNGSGFDNGVQEIKPPEETGIAGPAPGSPRADIFPPPLGWDED